MGALVPGVALLLEEETQLTIHNSQLTIHNYNTPFRGLGGFQLIIRQAKRLKEFQEYYRNNGNREALARARKHGNRVALAERSGARKHGPY